MFVQIGFSCCIWSPLRFVARTQSDWALFVVTHTTQLLLRCWWWSRRNAAWNVYSVSVASVYLWRRRIGKNLHRFIIFFFASLLAVDMDIDDVRVLISCQWYWLFFAWTVRCIDAFSMWSSEWYLYQWYYCLFLEYEYALHCMSAVLW